MVHPTFPDLAAASWCFPNLNLLETLDHFKSSMTEWNRDFFWNIFRNKRRTLARIEGIQKYLADRFSPYLANLESQLIHQFNQLILQEEILWYQKSRIKWINYGDKNTKLFHISTLARRRRNKLKREDGSWCNEITELKQIICEHFRSRFSVDEEIRFLPDPFILLPILLRPTHNLSMPTSVGEIWVALNSMGAHKAPGPDGFQAAFFQQHWELVKGKLCSYSAFDSGSIPDELSQTFIRLFERSPGFLFELCITS